MYWLSIDQEFFAHRFKKNIEKYVLGKWVACIISEILDLAILFQHFYFITWLPGHFLWKKMLTFQEIMSFVERLEFD